MRDFSFTPHTLRRIRGYVQNGVTGPSIAQKLGCDYGSLRNICWKHGMSLIAGPEVAAAAIEAPPVFAMKRSAGSADTIELQMGRLVAETYRRKALLYSCSYTALMGRVLEVSASDDLIHAILDVD